MPPLAPHNGVVSVGIEGDRVAVSAAFGTARSACRVVRREGACVMQACDLAFPPSFAMVPHAGDIEVRTPDGNVHRLVPGMTGTYADETRFPELSAAAGAFTFAAEGAGVPPFSVDIASPPPLDAVALPGAGPRSMLHDLEVAHAPWNAAFELRLSGACMNELCDAVVDCAFEGGAALVPAGILATLARDREIRAVAAGVSRRKLTAGDFDIEAVVVRDATAFTFRLR